MIRARPQTSASCQTLKLNHKYRVIYQIEIIADPKPSITLRHANKNRMRSSLIFNNHCVRFIDEISKWSHDTRFYECLP